MAHRIWIYTKENHPKKFDSTFTWGKNDVLLVQINDSKYKGYSLIPKKLQVVNEGTVQIVVALEKEAGNEQQFPRRFMEVEKNVLANKKFVVVTENGENVKLN